MVGLKLGDKIPLVGHLECPEGSTLYVEAVIKKPDRTEIANSPIDLTDEGSGLFFDDSELMPELDYLTVTYNIYEDALKTIQSDDFCSVTEVFNREIEDTGNEESLSSIELELDLESAQIDLDLGSGNIDIDLDNGSLDLEIGSSNLDIDIDNPEIDLNIDRIALELNLECCI